MVCETGYDSQKQITLENPGNIIRNLDIKYCDSIEEAIAE